MADANNPQGGSPSSPDSKGESFPPNASGPGIFRPAPPLQKDGEFDVYGRLTTQNRNLLRQNKVDGIRRKDEPTPENAKNLSEWKNAKRLDLGMLKAAFEQLENSGWTVPGIDEKGAQLKDLMTRVEVSKGEDKEQLENTLGELSVWAKEEQDLLLEAQNEYLLKTAQLKGEKRRLYNELDRRANVLSGKIDKKKEDDIQLELQALIWLQTDDGCEKNYDWELTELDKQLSSIERNIAKEEAELTKKDTEAREKARQQEIEGKIRVARQAATLITLFTSKKAEATTLLQTTSTTTEGQRAEALVRELDVLKITLESDDIKDDDIGRFKEKADELDAVVASLHSLVEKERSEKQEMVSGNATWPREIKYFEAKKPDRSGRGGEKAAWKKDGAVLADQPLWTKASDLSKIVFVKYNALVDKAFGAGLSEKVKSLVNSKELVINALVQLKVEDALKELVRLEKEVGSKSAEIENELELKDITIKFAIAKSSLERLTTISPLERTLLDAKTKEVEDLLKALEKDDAKTDPSKMKELLRVCKAVLGELLSGVEEKDKDTKREAAERLSEFKQLSRRLEQTRTEILHKLPKETSDEDKQSLLKKLDDIETKAKDFSTHEVAKEYSKARETLSLFKSSLDSLTTSIQEKVAATKALVSKSGETKTFGQAVSLFEQLKAEIADLEPANEEEGFFRRSVSEREKASFEKLVAELEEIKASRANTTDKKTLDEKDLLFRSLLIDLTSFVTQKMGDEDKLRAEIAILKQKLASTTSEKEKDRLLLKIARLERTFNGILSLKEARRSIAPRKNVLRPVKDSSTVFLRERDPLTGKAVEVTASEWRKQQSNSGTISTLEKVDSRLQAEEELRAIHKAMWQRDPEGYKSLYAGRVWTASGSNELIKKIVSEILGEKIDLVEGKLELHQGELDERNTLLRKLKTGVLSQEEKARLTSLEALLAPWIKERSSLIGELSYEDQLKAMRAQAAQKSELNKRKQVYSPSDDRKMDFIPVKGQAGDGVKSKGLFSALFGNGNSQAQQRYKIAKAAREYEAARAARDKIPGFTKVAANTSPLMGKLVDPIVKGDFDMTDPSKGDLGSDMRRLAETVYEQEVKLGTKASESDNAGMARSITKEERRKDDGSVEVRQGAYEATPQTKAPLTPEQQERKIAKVNSIMGTLTKVVKSWRAWALVGAFAAGMGGTSVAFAGMPAVTLGEMISWQDLAEGLAGREQLPEGFVKDLTSK